MSDLEDMGYLAQPHTSAGRIPSDKGYRVYVDSIRDIPALTEAEVELIKRHLGSKLRGQELILETAARLLSSLTNYTSIVLGPATAAARLHSLQIVPLDHNRAVVMVVTDGGLVVNEVVELPETLTHHDLSVLCEMTNRACTGKTLSELRNPERSGVPGAYHSGISAFESAMDQLIGSLQRKESEHLVLGGATNILNQPDFRDMQKLRGVLKVLEEEALVFKLVTAAAASPASVNIGSENPLEELRECSIITATYNLSGQGVGHISVLGPTRMEYGRVMALLRFVSRVISEK